jgi:hypothetical protein
MKAEARRRSEVQEAKIMAEICMSRSKGLGWRGLNAIEVKPGCLSPAYVKVPLAISDEKHSTQLQSTSRSPRLYYPGGGVCIRLGLRFG